MQKVKSITYTLVTFPLLLLKKIATYKRTLAYLFLTVTLLTTLFIGLLNYNPSEKFKSYLLKELSTSRETGFQASIAASWSRSGPAITATKLAISEWGSAIYPLALQLTTIWYDILCSIGPPMYVAVSNLNPLVYWAMVALTVVTVLLYLLRRECQRRKYFQRVSMAYERRTNATKRAWKRVSDGVKEKSVFAAKLLPHIVFVVVFLVLVWLSPTSIRNLLGDGQTIALFAVPLPLILSVRAILQPDYNETSTSSSAGTPSTTLAAATNTAATSAPSTSNVSATPSSSSSSGTVTPPQQQQRNRSSSSGATPTTIETTRKTWLSYWAMIATAYLIWSFPIVGATVIQRFEIFRLLLLAFVVWLQSPLTDGADLGLIILKKLLGRYVREVRTTVTPENSNFVLRMLVGFRIITDEQRIVFTEVVSDGSNVILLSLIFLVTPGFVTRVGCLLVGIGYPMYATVAAVTNHIPRAQKWWLIYWVAFVTFTMMHDFISIGFDWLPLWFHIRLCIIVWLQLPYFRGAEFLFLKIVSKWRNIQTSARRESMGNGSSGGSSGSVSGGSSGSVSRTPVVQGIPAVVDPGTPTVPSLPTSGDDTDSGIRRRGGGTSRRRDVTKKSTRRGLMTETTSDVLQEMKNSKKE